MSTTASAIEFRAPLETINDRSIIRIPAEASGQLPSRGQVAVEALIAEHPFTTVIEPDGRRGHWISLVPSVLAATGLTEGEQATISLTPTKAWPETTVPEDLADALDDAGGLEETWAGLTPMARWEWVRWIRATRSPDTRARRVEVAISKLQSGKRRPCCFDLSSCTDPELSKSGKLLDIR